MTQVLKGEDVTVVKAVVPAQEIAVELPPNWVRLDDGVMASLKWLDLSDITDYVNEVISTDLARLIENRQRQYAESVEF